VKRRVVKTAPAIVVVEYVFMISFQGLPFFKGIRCSVGNVRARAAPFRETGAAGI
jgi:hypothetical protein